MKILMLAFSLLLSTNLFAEDVSLYGKIVMKMDNFHNDTGIVKIALFLTGDGFPDQPTKAIKTLDVEIHDGKVNETFLDIPYGTYAVSVLHDENSSGDMDTNWIGMPKEGYGVSNDARAPFGPPKFDDAKFPLNAEELQLYMVIQY